MVWAIIVVAWLIVLIARVINKPDTFDKAIMIVMFVITILTIIIKLK